MNTIAMYIGYVVIIGIFLIGAIMTILVIAARLQDKIPYFIGYRALMKKSDEDFEKWIDALRYVRNSDRRKKQTH